MTTPMLLRFSQAVIVRLADEGLVELADDSVHTATRDVASALAAVTTGSLLSEIMRALMSSAAVVEVYADDDDLKRIIEALDPADARR